MIRRHWEKAGAQFFHSVTAGFFFTNAWYSFVSKLDRNAEATFLNYGFAGPSDEKLELEPQLEVNRYTIQLYHHVVSSVPLQGKDVLEIGCGRGGGASYVARYMRPRHFVGLDINKTAINFDRRFYKTQKNLQFIVGDAHAMPFPEETFDVAVNVESSHHYNDLGRFLGEVHRVLKPGGSFLMACFPRKNEPSFLRRLLDKSRFTCILEEDITPNVIRALEIDSARREDAVRRLCPAPLRTFGREFAGVRGSELYESFVSGKRRYLNFVLHKKA
jgi:ubiquinone/menaquinone biosynthesis C-methylase UbiE